MQKTNFLIPKEHKKFPALMQKYKGVFETVESAKGKNLVIRIPPEVADSKDNTMWGELIGVAEHNRKWIELLLFGVEFSFIKIADSELTYAEGEWQSDRKIQKWLHRIGDGIPFSFFFLHKWEARLLTVTGDMVSKGDDIITPRDENHVKFSFNREEQKIIDSRVGVGCQVFMHYCNGTGFDPKQAVEAVLAEFKVPYEYDMVLKEFEKDVETKTQYRIGYGDEKPGV
ncbi:MAG: hypothetical protein ISS16_10280 [Ignavibacteria bacterium]|nr:hypothetical protein [Ignavibacteria bacterium]